ncbi:MAG: gamma-glutamyl-gamma-aminobutyrate hydrolase family protein [Nitrospiraceae bacterium]|nr:MAG: gamma-glutamyl-gamma-aminobutyrate hydrolase family protein [Nitrospiraceae bacterium]
MPVLIVKNTASEGPGTIADFLAREGIPFRLVDFSDCASDPEIPDIREHSHLIIMGGPMAVYDSAGMPFLHYEVAMIRAFIRSGKPVLGVCLGAQVLAHSLKAEVFAGGKEEIGWDRVDITPEGMEDPVFSTLAVDGAPCAEVFQWHGDTFDLPAKAVRLASSGTYQNQAFRYGANAYGLQFHIEVTPQIIEEWFGKEEGTRLQEMIQEARRIFPGYHQRALRFYEKFFTPLK